MRNRKLARISNEFRAGNPLAGCNLAADDLSPPPRNRRNLREASERHAGNMELSHSEFRNPATHPENKAATTASIVLAFASVYFFWARPIRPSASERP